MNARTLKFAAASAAMAFLAGCASVSAPAARPVATATIAPASGSQISGSASFRAIAGGLHLDAVVTGLTPGDHGFHIHEVGDCSAADATSAKGHYNPYAKHHGSHEHDDHHAGDMPNLTADASGKATFSVDLPGLNAGSGEGGILNRAVVIHADPDDYKSQPAGNSGKRVACGVIKAQVD